MLSSREGDSKQGIRYSSPPLTGSHFSRATCGCQPKVNTMLTLPLLAVIHQQSLAVCIIYMNIRSWTEADRAISSAILIKPLRINILLGSIFAHCSLTFTERTLCFLTQANPPQVNEEVLQFLFIILVFFRFSADFLPHTHGKNMARLIVVLQLQPTQWTERPLILCSLMMQQDNNSVSRRAS